MEITLEPPARKGRAGRVLFNLACVLVSLGAVAFLVPAAFGMQRYVIAGGSMTGSIARGSVVFEEVVPVAELRVGDVITYLPPADSGVDNLVTHRIVSIKGDTFHTKGDANPDPDPWTFELTGATQPRVVQHVPYVGYAILALQDRTTRMVVIGIPAALVALWSLVELAGVVRRRPSTDAPGPDLRVPAQRGPESAGLPSPPSSPPSSRPSSPPSSRPTRPSETVGS